MEGAELLVLKGGFETIKKFKPKIFLEMLRKWSKKFGYHPNEIIDMLKGIGYQCFVIENGELVPFGYVDDETVQTNYFFIYK